MKNPKDPRHLERIRQVNNLYALSFNPKQPVRPEVKKILAKIKKIDQVISEIALLFPIKRINAVDLAILRLAVYEINFSRNPVKVVIDEAIEIAKLIGNENSPKFINGALGKLVKNDQK